MRRFKIQNANGATYDLTVNNREFMYGVRGLGYSDEVEYRRIANIYKRLSDYKAQGKIEGTIHFFGNEKPHKRYFDLVQFLQVKPLTLVYTPEDINVTYYRSGTVTDVDFDETNPLSASITFTCTTLWYERFSAITRPDSELVNGKIYNYTYNYTYRNSIANTVTIDVLGYELSPVKLSLFGKLVNPEWTQYINGKEVASGKVNYTIPSGYKLQVDTTDLPYSIKMYDSNDNFIIDLYSYSDFGTERFLTLQNGINTISVNDDEGNKVVIKAEALLSYASV